MCQSFKMAFGMNVSVQETKCYQKVNHVVTLCLKQLILAPALHPHHVVLNIHAVLLIHFSKCQHI